MEKVYSLDHPTGDVKVHPLKNKQIEHAQLRVVDVLTKFSKTTVIVEVITGQNTFDIIGNKAQLKLNIKSPNLLTILEKFYQQMQQQHIYSVVIPFDDSPPPSLNQIINVLELAKVLERLQNTYNVDTLLLTLESKNYYELTETYQRSPVTLPAKVLALDKRTALLNQHRKPLLGADVSHPDRPRHIEELNWEESGIWIDEKGKEWVLPHSKSFPDFIAKEFGHYALKPGVFKLQCETVTGERSDPFPYQEFILEYMRFGTPYRGLILEHGLGSGKSRSAIMVAETFRKEGLDILFLTPAFLKNNFMEELLKWGNDDIRLPDNYEQLSSSQQQLLVEEKKNIILKSYHFVSYNAGGGSGKSTKKRVDAFIGPYGKGGLMYRLAELGIGHPPDVGGKYYWNKSVRDLVENLVKEGRLPETNSLHYPRNMLIIVEEAHDLNAKFISGESKVMGQLYPILKHAEDCKIMYLTATPVNNNVFELCTLYNVLRGPVSATDNNLRLFPEDEATFLEKFIDLSSLKPMHEYYFQKRILGLHSKFRGIKEDPLRDVYPLKVDHVIVDVPMSFYQTKIHDVYLKEELEKEIKQKKKTNVFKMKLPSAVGATARQAEVNASYANMKKATSSFRAKSRQACNYVFPEGVVRPRPTVSIDLGYTYKFGFDPVLEDPSIIEDSEFADKFTDILEQYPDDEEKWNQSMTEYINKKYADGGLQNTNIWDLLDDESKYMYVQQNESDYQTRINSSFNRLKENAKRYFSDEEMSKCGAKIMHIYETIMTDFENGALHLEEGTMPPDEKLGMPYTLPEQLLPEESILEEDPTLSEDDASVMENTYIEIPELRRVIDDPRVVLNNYQDDETLRKENKHSVGGPALVYSFFNTIEGAGITALFLKTRGFEEYVDSDLYIDVNKIPMKPRYALITGQGRTSSPSTRQAIMRVFNHPRNRHGQLIQIIFVTQAAAQGISLFNIRQIHIMEPFWGNVKIRQVIGRGIRLCSHRNLPFLQRVVHVWQYHAVRYGYNADPSKIDLRKRNEAVSAWKAIAHDMEYAYDITTDKYVQQIADQKDKLIFGFSHIIDNAAVDCQLNHSQNTDDVSKIECIQFSKVNVTDRAYYPNLEDDFIRDPAPKKIITKVTTQRIKAGPFEGIIRMDEAKVAIKIKDERKEVQNVYDADRANMNVWVQIGYYLNGQFIKKKTPEPAPKLTATPILASVPTPTPTPTPKSASAPTPKLTATPKSASIPIQLNMVEGNLLTMSLGDNEYILHQANSKSKSGYGLAADIFKKYPQANIYKSGYTSRKAGDVIITKPVIALVGQQSPGKPTATETRDIRLVWFNQALNKLKSMINNGGLKVDTLYFPYLIGSGLAGGNWTDYSNAILSFSKDLNAKVMVVKLKEFS